MSKKCKYNGSEVYFTSDTHFYHSNILKFCGRPYKDVEEMNEALISNWNKVITSNNIHVFHTGDFCFGGPQAWIEIVKRLNGIIHLILGNHDHKQMTITAMSKLFHEVTYQKTIFIREDNQEIVLNHYPFLAYAGSERGVINLFGHVHYKENYTGSDAERLTHLQKNQYDVGVDNNNYTPVSYEQILDILKEQKMTKLFGNEKYLNKTI